MMLHLTIENETTLPDGGPLSITVRGTRGIDIGRDAYLDWTLPDPTRTISGKHCEVRFRDGAYWLHDVSRNGTFLNRSDQRLGGPHRLRDGDHFAVGRYIIAARVEGEGEVETATAPEAVPARPLPDDYWSPAGGEAAPIPARELQAARVLRPVHAGFDEWAVDLPGPLPAARDTWDPADPARQQGRAVAMEAAHAAPEAWVPDSVDDWAAATPAAPPPAPTPAPTPRRARPAAPAASLPEWDPAAPVAPAQPPAAWEPPAPPAPVTATPEPAPPAPRGGRSRGPEPEASAYDPASGADAMMARLARGLGVPEAVFAGRDPEALAEEIGGLLRLVAEHLKTLLAARAESKRATRATQQTMIQALDNNPLKFSPTVEDALRIMFAGDNAGYLDARRAFEQGFRDLKAHQVKTYAAMQNGLRLLLQDLEPAAIDEAVADSMLDGLVGSRRARLWNTYVTRWNAMTAPHEGGMTDAFMMFFAECYDRGGAAPWSLSHDPLRA